MRDRKITIATGSSRTATSWEATELTWSALAKTLETAQRTPETVTEYQSFTRSQKAATKDVGGYVGGHLAGKRRKARSVLSRSLLTLDVDSGSLGPWMDVLLGDNAAVLHTTHSHTEEAPSYRVVMPLDRDAAPEEYEALARRMAYKLGLHEFDPSTYQPERLMFWPSVSLDGVYNYELVEGRLLSVDNVLSEYADWHDMSSWPRSSRETQLVDKARTGALAADPTKKAGIVGAFCRVFDIHAAIHTFIPEKYRATIYADRYSWAEGSGEAGFVVYDAGTLAMSMHGTDPVAGPHCVNAFDLVRIHLFGHLDTDTAETGPTGMPSYVAMCEHVSNRLDVKTQLFNDKRAQTAEAFKVFLEPGMASVQNRAAVIPDPGAKLVWESTSSRAEKKPEPVAKTHETQADPEQAGSWMDFLDVDKKTGQIRPSDANIQLIFASDPNLSGLFFLDIFSNTRRLSRCPVWSTLRREDRYGAEGLALLDSDHANLRVYFSLTYGIHTGGRIADGLETAISRNLRHPVREYLTELVWDGTERLDTALIDIMGAADTEYTRLVTRKTLVAAVARVFEPGCKFDHVLTLTGAQGLGKSTFAAKLGGKWYNARPGELGSVRAAENLKGTWIMELGDLSGVKRADIDEIKNFITTSIDHYRPAYGREVQSIPRQSIYIASSNDDKPLRDEDGNRRWWVVAVGERSTVLGTRGLMTPEYVHQLWAEAFRRYAEGETLYLTHEQEAQATQVQAASTEADPWIELIDNYLEMPIPDNYVELALDIRQQYFAGKLPLEADRVRERVCIMQIADECLQMPRHHVNDWTAKRIGKAMRKLKNWSKLSRMRIGGYGKVNGFRRIDAVHPSTLTG